MGRGVGWCASRRCGEVMSNAGMGGCHMLGWGDVTSHAGYLIGHPMLGIYLDIPCHVFNWSFNAYQFLNNDILIKISFFKMRDPATE